MQSLLMLLLSGVLGARAAAFGEFVNSGTPAGAPFDVDCAVRKTAWEFGKAKLPNRGGFKTLFDALQLQVCGVAAKMEDDVFKALEHEAKGKVIFVATDGSNENAGTLEKPLLSIEAALDSVSKRRKEGERGEFTISLRGGVYEVDGIRITRVHSNVTVQNYKGEAATISGGVAFQIPKKDWRPFLQEKMAWRRYAGESNVFGLIQPQTSSPGFEYVGNFKAVEGCASKAEATPKLGLGDFHAGSGGYCDDLDPPFGYWCASKPPRGQCWDAETNTGQGCVQTHMKS
ncbi:hypothetical protein M885DRAFT_564118 [Pelagophyceae sp. CCMP2097]|nr:hypothetical protein M885DRAFT_564118 [Pelagophyceae sp. CCMP2097]